MSLAYRAVEQTAVDMLNRGEATPAIELLTRALNEAPGELPGEGRLRELRGWACWELGDVQQSVHELETAMSLVPLGAEGTLALALGYEVMQKRDLSIGLLNQLVDRRTLPLRVLESLARALGRAGEFAKALDICQRASAAQPDELAPLMGVVFYQGRVGGSPEWLLEPLFRALHLAPEDFSIRMLTARCLHDCGLSEDAADVLRAVEYLESCCPSCLNTMHEIFRACGDSAAAAAVVEKLSLVAEALQRE